MRPSEEIERRLAHQKGAASDPATNALPPGFEERLDVLGASPTEEAVRDEQERLSREAERLFKQLGGADKEVVQAARRRQIRAIVNAQRRLEQLAVR